MTVAWIALAVSALNLAIFVWDKFLRRSKFAVQADWIISASEPTLRFVVLNVGWRKDTVRDIRLKEKAMPRGRGWTPYERVMTRLPIVLDVDEASPAFLLQLSTHPRDALEDALATSRIDEIEIENARGEISCFELPALYLAKRNAELNDGPALQKGSV